MLADRWNIHTNQCLLEDGGVNVEEMKLHLKVEFLHFIFRILIQPNSSANAALNMNYYDSTEF